MFRVFSIVSETSVRLSGLRFFEPLKIIFSIFAERNRELFCSPSTQRMASTILVFPHPFGPTIAVRPLSNLILVLCAKLLKPKSSILERYIAQPVKIEKNTSVSPLLLFPVSPPFQPVLEGIPVPRKCSSGKRAKLTNKYRAKKIAQA